jgi:hypothetical protein
VVEQKPRFSKRIIAVVLLIGLVLPLGIVSAAVVSNWLTIGPYTVAADIAITQVVSPVSTCTVAVSTDNTLMEAAYASALQLPIPSGALSALVWYKTGVQVVATYTTSVNVIENYAVTYSGAGTPTTPDLKLVYCDQTTHLWTTLTPDYTAFVWSGTVTSAYIQPAGTYTTPVMMLVLVAGTYNAQEWFTDA